MLIAPIRRDLRPVSRVRSEHPQDVTAALASIKSSTLNATGLRVVEDKNVQLCNQWPVLNNTCADVNLRCKSARHWGPTATPVLAFVGAQPYIPCEFRP
jgi:hypothetical protein